MGALDGIRIVEIDGLGPVPFAAMLLADMGADVIRIARAGRNPLSEMGATVLHRGRDKLLIDLKSPEGVEAALALIGKADALIEGFRPGVMERLGLGPDTCLASNPRLVYGRMTGWGQDGPRAMTAGHDINYIAIAGALGAMGEAGRPPLPPLNLVGDYGGGAMMLALGVLAGVISAGRTGRGQVVDAAMTDGTAALMSLFVGYRQEGGWRRERGTNLLDGSAPFYRCYACADQRHVAVGALEPQFFARLVDGLGFAPGSFDQHDRSGWPAMADAFARRFAEKPRDAWAAVFADTDACVTPVLDIDEAARDPHNAARETFVDIGGKRHPAPAPRFLATPSAIAPAGTLTLEAALSRWGAAR